MNDIDWSLLYDEVLLFALATLKLILWLVLRRRTVVGRAIASSVLSMSIVYYCSFVALHNDWFAALPWRAFLRVIVGITTVYALWAIAGYFGGWRGLLHEVRCGVVELGEAARAAWGMACWRWRRWRCR